MGSGASQQKLVRSYRDPTLVVDDLKPLVLDMVDNMLTISKSTMGRGASASAKRSTSQMMAMFVRRIMGLHDQLFAMNQVNPDSVDPCVVAMADHMLCILWKKLQEKYTQTLASLHLTLEPEYFHHFPTRAFCRQHQLHDRMLGIFDRALTLVSLTNDAASAEELAMLLSESKRSMFVMIRGELTRFNNALAKLPHAVLARSDVEFMKLMSEAIVISLECVQKVDQNVILSVGKLGDTRTLPPNVTSTLLLPSPSLPSVAHKAKDAPIPRKANSMITLSLTKKAEPKERAQSASVLPRLPSKELAVTSIDDIQKVPAIPGGRAVLPSIEEDCDSPPPPTVAKTDNTILNVVES